MRKLVQTIQKLRRENKELCVRCEKWTDIGNTLQEISVLKDRRIEQLIEIEAFLETRVEQEETRVEQEETLGILRLKNLKADIILYNIKGPLYRLTHQCPIGKVDE